MREIKFRAWDAKSNSFFKPTFEAYRGRLEDLLIGTSGSLFLHTMNGNEHESLFPDRFILNQFTGLRDKTGKEIHEGDIIYIGHPHKGRTYTGEIIYEKNRFTAKGFNFAHHDDPSDPFESLEYMEVIGNIYENPGLLESEGK